MRTASERQYSLADCFQKQRLPDEKLGSEWHCCCWQSPGVPESAVVSQPGKPKKHSE